MGGMIAFSTQREVLEYLGKNPNDRSLIQRMVARWEVVKEDWMYYVKEAEQLNSMNFEQTAKILELQGEIERLTGERNHLEQELEKWKDGGESSYDQSDLDFQIAENERLEAKVANYQEAIRRCYLWAVNVKKDKTPWPIFKKEILKLEEELPWEDNQ